MTETERKAVMASVPILSGFLATLLEDADDCYDDVRSDDTIYTCPDATFQAAADICQRFLAMPGVADMLDETAPDWRWHSLTGSNVGADLYLTVAGHGAGFWDGDWEPHGDALTQAAQKALKAVYVAVHPDLRLLPLHAPDMFTFETYVGDGGHVYISGREG